MQFDLSNAAWAHIFKHQSFYFQGFENQWGPSTSCKGVRKCKCTKFVAGQAEG
jgi:hypothetical protein